MKIAIIGAGAMGCIYGGHLSLNNEVLLVDTNSEIVNKINNNGLKISENNSENYYYPKACTNTKNEGEMDLLILFVKAMYSEVALTQNKNLIGKNTFLMTLQNGSGHEDVLKKFAPLENIIIGTTSDNGAILGKGQVRRGGQGKTDIGMLIKGNQQFINRVKTSFDSCGFTTTIHENIQQLIWDKLLRNVSLSAVTGALQCNIGYVYENKNAWILVNQLLKEAIVVAHKLGLKADEEKILGQIKNTAINSKNGVTSICADIRNGRKTEVDTITGSVVRAASKVNVEVPSHVFILNMIHSLESLNKEEM
jgi:2-dehydropantoate 2-reductase